MLVWVVSLIVMSIDQVVKFFIEKTIYNREIVLIDNIFSLTYVQNKGAAWGFLSNYDFLLKLFIPVFIIIIAVYLFNSKKERFELISGSLIIGGALGNYIDRLFRGYVVDFLNFNVIPVFNFADVCIVVGCGLMLIKFIFLEKIVDK